MSCHDCSGLCLRRSLSGRLECRLDRGHDGLCHAIIDTPDGLRLVSFTAAMRLVPAVELQPSVASPPERVELGVAPRSVFVTP